MSRRALLFVGAAAVLFPLAWSLGDRLAGIDLNRRRNRSRRR